MAYVGFSALKNKLSHESGIRNPGAVAAAIGRKKYGEQKMAKASSFGRENPGAKPMLAPVRG
jgi:hypothetical protein